jgi:hypothetical protein
MSKKVGKYVYLTQKEMQSIVEYIKTKGRVNRVELAAKCNTIIRVNPKGEDLQIINQEENNLLQDIQK